MIFIAPRYDHSNEDQHECLLLKCSRHPQEESPRCIPRIQQDGKGFAYIGVTERSLVTFFVFNSKRQ